LITPVPKQSFLSLLSGSVQTYRRNFGKLFLIFGLSFIVMLLPLLFNLDTYVTQLHQVVVDQENTSMVYTIIYILRPLMDNGQLEAAFISIWIIGVFTTPLFMGMAGKIALDDAAGEKCTLKEAFRWTLGHYRHLLFAYALYYAIFLAYSISMFALLYWIVRGVSHLIGDVWTNPTIVLSIIGFAILLVGTIYLPFVAMDEKKGSFHAYTGSFKAMYSRSFIHNFPRLLLAAAMAGAVAVAAIYPVAPAFFTGEYGDAMQFLTIYNSTMILILAAVAIFSFVGVFLYIFAYNIYRSAGTVSCRNRRVNVETVYRRKINIVEPTYRRRIG
jgi:hypothetical protein